MEDTMKLSFLPREEKFFFFFQQSTANLKATAAKLQDLMENYENVPEKVAEIKRLEEVGDTIIHTIMTSLHKTFVTPLDREDIATLGERLDDIVDSMEEAARIMVEYRIEDSTEEAKELSRILFRCADTLDQAIGLLHFRGSKLEAILPLATDINTYENEADQVVSRAMAVLFNGDATPIYVLKWKEVYDLLEQATDFCEDAANMLEGIVLKHA
jgi:predicted phosphate transport protein (TIGR00153 family)